ncbi:hypothetical protein GCM10009693_13290 [Leucobacter chromiireducens subsp. chromiireducens]
MGIVGCSGNVGGRIDEGAARTSENAEAIGGDIVAPLTLGLNELEGHLIKLQVGQVLNIDVSIESVASYRGAVSDPDVAAFTAGYRDDSAVFNPGVTALSLGTTRVTLTNEQSGEEPIQIDIEVTK